MSVCACICVSLYVYVCGVRLCSAEEEECCCITALLDINEYLLVCENTIF